MKEKYYIKIYDKKNVYEVFSIDNFEDIYKKIEEYSKYISSDILYIEISKEEKELFYTFWKNKLKKEDKKEHLYCRFVYKTDTIEVAVKNLEQLKEYVEEELIEKDNVYLEIRKESIEEKRTENLLKIFNIAFDFRVKQKMSKKDIIKMIESYKLADLIAYFTELEDNSVLRWIEPETMNSGYKWKKYLNEDTNEIDYNELSKELTKDFLELLKDVNSVYIEEISEDLVLLIEDESKVENVYDERVHYLITFVKDLEKYILEKDWF